MKRLKKILRKLALILGAPAWIPLLAIGVFTYVIGEKYPGPSPCHNRRSCGFDDPSGVVCPQWDECYATPLVKE